MKLAIILLAILSLGFTNWHTQSDIVVNHTPVYGDEEFQDKVRGYLEEVGERRGDSKWLYIIDGYNVYFASSPGCPGAMCAFLHYGTISAVGVQPKLEVSREFGAAMVIHELQHLKDMRRGERENPDFECWAWEAMQNSAVYSDLKEYEQDWVGWGVAVSCES